MRIEDYKLKIKVYYSRQAKTGRGSAVFNYTQAIINQSSFDFISLEVKYHGTVLFTLRYKSDNYFLLHDSPIKEHCRIKFPRGPTDYGPWILAILKEIITYYHKNQMTGLKEIITKLEQVKSLPNVAIEVVKDY